jgi:hypothetical protein
LKNVETQGKWNAIGRKETLQRISQIKAIKNQHDNLRTQQIVEKAFRCPTVPSSPDRLKKINSFDRDNLINTP